MNKPRQPNAGTPSQRLERALADSARRAGPQPVGNPKQVCCADLKADIATDKVACPGHLHAMQATVAPTGGKCRWSITGRDVRLVDANLKPQATGTRLYLHAFAPDNTKGEIPSRSARVTLTYAHDQCGTVSVTKDILVHGVRFKVRRLRRQDIKRRRCRAKATGNGGFAFGGRDAGKDMIKAKPSVQIRLDANCPRKRACARTYQVGWVQTLFLIRHVKRFEQQCDGAAKQTPCRDGAQKFPYIVKDPQAFARDRQWLRPPFDDSPGWGSSFYPMQLGNTTANQACLWVSYQFDATAWLVVENREESGRLSAQQRKTAVLGTFVFLRHFHWCFALCVHSIIEDQRRRGRFRFKPRWVKVGLKGPFVGKGAKTPSLREATTGLLHCTAPRLGASRVKTPCQERCSCEKTGAQPTGCLPKAAGGTK